ncbi:YkgJ family cysteine cluster protein [Candidatus Bathyarchaeota archaeon]|nr:YkgJ family cysteine cluster protein [Candidatus Bathyarchaeota archaeon]
MPVQSERQNNFFNVCKDCKDSCCRNARPPINSKRKKIIETYLKKHKIPIKNPFVQASYVFLREDAEGYCIFYDKTTMKCLVHPVKPETCVAGPVTFDINMPHQKIGWFLKKEKICALAGMLYKNEGNLEKHLTSAKKEILNLLHGLNSEDLSAILKIEEPETFKIDEDKIDDNVANKLNIKRKQSCKTSSVSLEKRI